MPRALATVTILLLLGGTGLYFSSDDPPEVATTPATENAGMATTEGPRTSSPTVAAEPAVADADDENPTDDGEEVLAESKDTPVEAATTERSNPELATAPTRTPATTTRTTTARVVQPPAPATPAYRPPVARNDGLADLDLTPPDDDGATPGLTDVSQYHDTARLGRLTPSDVMVLEMVPTDDGAYTSSRALLLMNAEQGRDMRAVKRYLDQLMVLPENRYNPIYLSKTAAHDVNRGNYGGALETARLAERYWARIPPEIVFETKAEIYESQASAYQGLFYSNQNDLDLLENAITSWEKYRRHVESRSRNDLASRADQKLSQLRDIQDRLQ